MCLQLRDALRVGCIGLSHKFFSTTMEPKEMLKIMDDELRNFCVLIEPPKSPFGKGELAAQLVHRRSFSHPIVSHALTVKKTYSGKVGGRNDDIAIVMQLAITGARCVHPRPLSFACNTDDVATSQTFQAVLPVGKVPELPPGGLLTVYRVFLSPGTGLRNTTLV